MFAIDRRTLIVAGLAFGVRPVGAQGAVQDTFVCPPCGCAMDDVIFSEPGRCPDCGMVLAPRNEVDLGFQPQSLPPGAGRFAMEGGRGRRDAHVSVQYFRPRQWGPDSPILLVIPGAGRNADDYRNMWIETACAKNVFVAALGYPEARYGLSAYHMGGVVRDLTLRRPPVREQVGPTEIIRMADEDIVTTPHPKPEDWLYQDFDRIFDHIVLATGSRRTVYDLFGHSAGGQIAHRLALFAPNAKAARIVAANAGWYTMPDLDTPVPRGLGGSGLTDDGLALSFAKDLLILLGEDDDGDHAGGSLLRTPALDALGVGRRQRGRSFFEAARQEAQILGVPFKWMMEIVAHVGHDPYAMSRAAARRLYP